MTGQVVRALQAGPMLEAVHCLPSSDWQKSSPTVNTLQQPVPLADGVHQALPGRTRRVRYPAVAVQRLARHPLVRQPLTGFHESAYSVSCHQAREGASETLRFSTIWPRFAVVRPPKHLVVDSHILLYTNFSGRAAYAQHWRSWQPNARLPEQELRNVSQERPKQHSSR